MNNNSPDLSELLRSLTAYRSADAPPAPSHEEQTPYGQYAYGQPQFSNETSINGQQSYVQQQQISYGPSATNHHQNYVQPQTQHQNGGIYPQTRTTPFDPVVLPRTVTQQELVGNLNQTPLNHYNQYPVPSNAYRQYAQVPYDMSVNNAPSSTPPLLDNAMPQPPETLQPPETQAVPKAPTPSLPDQPAANLTQQSVPPTQNPRALPPGPDPREIIEWPAALRHVTRLAATNPEFGRSIRKLIANQDENERQWWAGREALRERQAARAESQRKLDEVMRAVGTKMPTGTTGMDDAAELTTYDKKVHGAMVKMEAAISGELCSLGIPFFETKPALIKDYITSGNSGAQEGSAGPTKKEQSKDGTGNDDNEGASSSQKRITKAEFMVLRRRMIQHLEDLYRE